MEIRSVTSVMPTCSVHRLRALSGIAFMQKIVSAIQERLRIQSAALNTAGRSF